MNVNGQHYRTIWMEDQVVCMIDQTKLPFSFEIFHSPDYQTTCYTISSMVVRGAGAIGAAAGYAMAQAARMAFETEDKELLSIAYQEILASRPTAINLKYHLDRVYAYAENPDAAKSLAGVLAEKNAEDGRMMGVHGKVLIKEGMNVLTHCNAGWLGFVDHGSALSPLYAAHREGLRFRVYADETRPRGQGARITAWELGQEGIECVIIPDNAAAWLMAEGNIDLVITGADRIALNGDTANKIGTLEKAMAANYYGIPFYIAAPLSTIDPNCQSGKEIPIEYRDPDEVLFQEGLGDSGMIERIRVSAPGAVALNPAFDVTPHSLIHGIITEKGIIPADLEAISRLSGL